MRKACASLEMIKWENLPGSLNEVVDIGKVVSGSIIVTGKDVSENHIKHLSRLGALAKYKTIHFATHGLAIQDAPELSALVLSQFSEEVKGEDGYLKVDEIQHLNIKSNLVNLSACETGLGEIYGGEGVVGLAPGFSCKLSQKNFLAPYHSMDCACVVRVSLLAKNTAVADSMENSAPVR